MTKKYGRDSYILGIDEVGRGALAGPLVVASVILPRDLRPRLRNVRKPLKDSKKLTARERELWFQYAKENPRVGYITVRASPRVVDRVNVSNAANLAATRACRKLMRGRKLLPAEIGIYLDGGLFLKGFEKMNPKTVVRGDEKINAVKLASIMAKVTRDRYMVRMNKLHPGYSFDEHKGYGTRKHKFAIRKHGLTKLHRLTFTKNIFK